LNDGQITLKSVHVTRTTPSNIAEITDQIPAQNSNTVLHPTLEEVSSAIKSLKNNRAPGSDGLPAEHFKYAGPDLVRSMYQIIEKIWIEEKIPGEWRNCIITPTFKKGDKMEYSNYRGISVLNVAYKILSNILCTRLKPYMENTIGKYQCGF
jgi:hypothetical protein